MHEMRTLFGKHWVSAVFAVTFLTAFFGQPVIWKFILDNDLKYQNVYSVVFDLNAIFLAFLFSYFSFVQTADNPFLNKVRKSNTFTEFSKQIVSTMTLSAIFLVIAIGTVAVAPVPGTVMDFHNLMFSVWCALICLIVLRFIMLNRVFWLFISQRNA